MFAIIRLSPLTVSLLLLLSASAALAQLAHEANATATADTVAPIWTIIPSSGLLQGQLHAAQTFKDMINEFTQRLVPRSGPFRSETSRTHELASSQLGVYTYVEYDYSLEVSNCVLRPPVYVSQDIVLFCTGISSCSYGVVLISKVTTINKVGWKLGTTISGGGILQEVSVDFERNDQFNEGGVSSQINRMTWTLSKGQFCQPAMVQFEMTCDVKATGTVMASLWSNQWDASRRGETSRFNYCREGHGALPISEVTQKADMVCRAISEPGRVTLDVGPNTLVTTPYELAGCLGLDD